MNKLDYMLNINVPKLLYEKEIAEIGDKTKISIGTYEKRGDIFQDVILELEDKEIFLGRFYKNEKSLTVKFKDGRILIGYNEFIKEVKDMRVIKVLALYELVDDIFYSCSEKEAINMFDPSIDDTYLKNKDALIHREDIEKIKRLR